VAKVVSSDINTNHIAASLAVEDRIITNDAHNYRGKHTSDDIEAQANISNPEDWLPDLNTVLSNQFHAQPQTAQPFCPKFQPVDASKNTCFINEAHKKSSNS